MTSTAASGIDWLRMGASMVLVLLLLAVLFWVLRRVKAMQHLGGQQRKMQLLETLSVGPRQKIALIRVGTREVLIGVSPSQFTALANWEGTAYTPDALDDSTGAAS